MCYQHIIFILKNFIQGHDGTILNWYVYKREQKSHLTLYVTLIDRYKISFFLSEWSSNSLIFDLWARLQFYWIDEVMGNTCYNRKIYPWYKIKIKDFQHTFCIYLSLGPITIYNSLCPNKYHYYYWTYYHPF